MRSYFDDVIPSSLTPYFRRRSIAPVADADLRRAVSQRLQDWLIFARQPEDPNWGHRGHAAYAIETLCRMMHTLRTGVLGSKAQSAAWALLTFPEPWRQLVAGLPTWKNDPTMDEALNQQVQALIIWGAGQKELGVLNLPGPLENSFSLSRRGKSTKC